MTETENLKRAITEHGIIFLTDHGSKNYYSGLRINIKRRINRYRFLKILPNWISTGIGLFVLSLLYKNPVFVTFGNAKSSYLLMILQYFASIFRSPKPHVLFDCLWEGGDTVSRKILIKLRAFLINCVITKCVVYGKKDLKSFNSDLGISVDKLIFCPIPSYISRL